MKKNKLVKIAVCIPWETPFIWTATSFNMLNWERPKNSEVNFILGVGWCPAARHNDAVAKAQSLGADLIMFNGPDHLCPRDILPRMLARIREGWDMVHAMPPCRGVVGYDGVPFKTISYKVVGPLPKVDPILHANPRSIEVVGWDNEPQQTHICGSGNIMMKAEILDGLQKPYFEEVIKKDGLYSRYCVQDSHFVYRCTIESGARMFCDTSIHLIHLDVFGIDETYSERFKDKTGQMDWSPAKDLKKFI
jgi:hypothetical protein